jgi:hypothetical protein
MNFYEIGAMNVFSQLGQLIEEDEKNQVKLTDLPPDVMSVIGSYLLNDKHKTIHKIFKNKKDDDLQIKLFGEVKDLTYINIYDDNNEIDYEMNGKLKNYVNFVLKSKGIKQTCEKMKVNFYVYRYKHYHPETNVNIVFCNKEDEEVAVIKYTFYNSSRILSDNKHVYSLSYFIGNGEWKKQNIQKNDIIDEYNSIRKKIVKEYFN